MLTERIDAFKYADINILLYKNFTVHLVISICDFTIRHRNSMILSYDYVYISNNFARIIKLMHSELFT